MTVSNSENSSGVSLLRVIPVVERGDASTTVESVGYGAPTGEAEVHFRRADQRQGSDRARPKTGTAPVRPETRAALRDRWKAARAAAEAMVQAAGQDPMGLAIAADNLELTLGGLWELRAARDIDWRTILNHVQGMVRQAFADKKVEQLTTEQCGCILEIVDRHLGPATKTTDDLNEVVRLIEDAGFDPYAAISGDPADDSES